MTAQTATTLQNHCRTAAGCLPYRLLVIREAAPLALQQLRCTVEAGTGAQADVRATIKPSVRTPGHAESPASAAVASARRARRVPGASQRPAPGSSGAAVAAAGLQLPFRSDTRGASTAMEPLPALRLVPRLPADHRGQSHPTARDAVITSSKKMMIFHHSGQRHLPIQAMSAGHERGSSRSRSGRVMAGIVAGLYT
jgi:hypothetical protein